MNNSHSRAFPSWPLTKIFDCILISLVTGNIIICAENGSITGVVLFHVDGRTVHVSQLIVSSKTALSRFISYYKLRYATYCVTGQRRGKLRIYNNIEKLFSLLQRI